MQTSTALEDKQRLLELLQTELEERGAELQVGLGCWSPA